MSIVRLGATKQYSDNWANIFGGGSRKSPAAKSAAKPAKKSPKKSAKAAPKTAAKKKAAGTKRKGR
jgi:hypothetical protein